MFCQPKMCVCVGEQTICGEPPRIFDVGRSPRQNRRLCIVGVLCVCIYRAWRHEFRHLSVRWRYCCWRLHDLCLSGLRSPHCYRVQCSHSNVDVISLTDVSTVDMSCLILHYCWLCVVLLCCWRYVVRLRVIAYLPSCALSFMITLYIIYTLELYAQSVRKLHCVRKKRGQQYIMYVHSFERFTRRCRNLWQAASRRYWKKNIVNTANIHFT